MGGIELFPLNDDISFAMASNSPPVDQSECALLAPNCRDKLGWAILLLHAVVFESQRFTCSLLPAIPSAILFHFSGIHSLIL